MKQYINLRDWKLTGTICHVHKKTQHDVTAWGVSYGNFGKIAKLIKTIITKRPISYY